MRIYLEQAWLGLRMWGRKQWTIAAIATLLTALVIGAATVLIPNPFFGRDIEPVWWNYPVWIATSLLMGMLVATYVQGSGLTEQGDNRTSAAGMAGGVLAWFAVGCPVCNKLALIALGYAGAIQWFAPVQPLLALGALALSTIALVVRLRGTVVCEVPA